MHGEEVVHGDLTLVNDLFFASMNRKKNLDPVRNRVIFSSSLLMALSPHFYLISVAPESLNNLGTLPQSVARYTGEYEIVEHGLYTDMEKQIHAARDFNG